MSFLGIQESFPTFTASSLLLLAFMIQNYKSPQPSSPELIHEAQRSATSKMDFNFCCGEKNLIVSYVANLDKSFLNAFASHNS